MLVYQRVCHSMWYPFLCWRNTWLSLGKMRGSVRVWWGYPGPHMSCTVVMKHGDASTWSCNIFKAHQFPYGYGSIPIHTIFNGMNIHKSQLFWCEQKGYKVLTHCHMDVHPTKNGIYRYWSIPICFFLVISKCLLAKHRVENDGTWAQSPRVWRVTKKYFA